MELKGRALFNLMRISSKEHPPETRLLWQVEDLRTQTTEELFARLKKLGLILDEKSFSLYVENNETPEELLECVCDEEDSIERVDQLYLLLFELWRRLIKDKFALSVFCDQLDHWIDQYDQDALTDEEGLQSSVALLEDILDEAFDKGMPPQQILKEVSCYCAHDLEQFIIDYIDDQLLKRNDVYASELIEAFCVYATDRRRFDLFRACLIALTDAQSAQECYAQIVKELYTRPDLEMALQALEHLIHHGHLKLFVQIAKLALSLATQEEELQIVLMMMAEYYRCSDKEESEQQVLQWLEERKERPLTAALDRKDRLITAAQSLLEAGE